jgi:hypothetical protein
MTVRELIQRLQELPNPDAVVVIAHGWGRDLLVVSGVVERRVQRIEGNPDFAGPGTEPGVEIV